MSHPEVDDEITVAASAVPFHAASGWAVVEEKTDNERADDGESDGEKTKGGRASASAAKKKESN